MLIKGFQYFTKQHQTLTWKRHLHLLLKQRHFFFISVYRNLLISGKKIK